MEILFDNPLANLYGPYFLLLYGFLIFFIIISLAIVRAGMDRSDRLAVPSIPSAVDPFEVAYLRGGENELARAVTFALVQKELIRLNGAGRYAKLEPSEMTRPVPLAPIERTAMQWFAGERKAQDLFGRNGLANELSGYAAEYRRRLERQQLLTSIAGFWRPATQFAILAVLAVGIYKLAAALMHGHRNFLYTIVFMIVGVAGVAIVSVVPRVSKLGRAYVECLKTAFGTLKTAEPARIYGEKTSFAAVDPILLSVGVFGTAALAGSMFESYQRTFPRSDNGTFGASSCSGGCGSVSDSSGGSSCSSSGCSSGCGGGCGGCGGG